MASVSELLLQKSSNLPPDLLRDRVSALPSPAILDGAPGFGEIGRWSFLGAFPRFEFQATGDHWIIRGRSSQERGNRISEGTGCLDRLSALIQTLGLDPQPAPHPDQPDMPPFQGGFIGFVGYDIAPLIEHLPRREPRDSRIPDIHLALYDTFATIDHLKQSVTLWAADLLGEGQTAVKRRLARFERELQTRAPQVLPTVLKTPITSDFTQAEYEAAVRQALEYIRAGDIFQVNLSQRFHAIANSVDPRTLHQRLRQISPVPLGAFIPYGNWAVVSASPELFYETRGRKIYTRPIKGTRPRDPDPARDAELAQELAASAKDRAELTMIIDLERNDLGRICEYGTVQVTQPMTLESYAQVHHMVATVQGELRPGVAAADIMQAMMPGGSITGAPKIRAMQIIDELEKNRRSLYTGAIGYIGRNGRSAFNIAIRTLLVEDKKLSYQAGGGIVIDSDPATEYEETLHKGRGLFQLLGGEEPRP